MPTITLFQDTARKLCQRISSSNSDFGPLVFLRSEIGATWASRFSVTVNDNIGEIYHAPAADGTFYFNRYEGSLQLSSGFLAQWEALAARMREFPGMPGGPTDITVEDVFTLFLLHEFAHIEQNLTAERHADIRAAQNVLRTVDYFADILAILMAVRLDNTGWSGDQNNEAERLAMGRMAYAAMLAARVFNTFDPTLLRLTPNRVRRIFLLYMQHFRIISKDMIPNALQLLYEPAVDFRNVRATNMQGHDELNRDSFRNLLADGHGTTLLWVTFPARYLTPKVIRISDAGAHYGLMAGNLAEMIFDPHDLTKNYQAGRNLFNFIRGAGDGGQLFKLPEHEALVNYAQ